MEDPQGILIYITIGSAAMLFFIVALIAFAIRYQRRMFLKDSRILTMQQEKQIALFKAIAETEEKERERIFRNLHDSVNPMLAGLRMSLDKHSVDISKNKFDPEELLKDREVIDVAIESIRSSAYDLVPSFMLSNGLMKSLDEYVRMIKEGGKIMANFENRLAYWNNLPFTKQEELTIFRISLEISNNIIKHSGCENFRIVIESTDNVFAVTFTHDGNGLNNEEADRLRDSAKGAGLKSLKARALLLNADLDYYDGDTAEVNEKSKTKLAVVSLKIPLKT